MVLILIVAAWVTVTEIRCEGLRQQVRVMSLISPGISRQEAEYRMGRPPSAVVGYNTDAGERGLMLRYTYRFLGVPMDPFWVLLDSKGSVVSVYYPWGRGTMASVHPQHEPR